MVCTENVSCTDMDLPQSPEPALHCAATWQIQCHDRATLQGVRISSAILKIVFRHILFFVFNAVRL